MYQVNRAEQLWKNWEDRQKQLQSVPEIDMNSMKTLKFKYDFLRKGLYRISSNPSEKEKLYLHVIQAVADKIQRKLYPNRFVRLFHRLTSALIEKPLHLRSFNRHKEDNMELLKSQLKVLGLSPFADRLENHLDFESTAIHVPALGRLSDNSTLSLKMNFEKDQLGSYQFESYKATMTRDNGEKTTCNFSSKSRLGVDEAINLLQGRAVRKDYQEMDGAVSRKWVQLDFREKDIHGEPQIAVYADVSGFDLKKTLTDYAVQLEHYSILKESVVQALEQGNIVSFKLPGQEQYYMQANPGEGKIDFFGTDMSPVSFDAIKAGLNEIKNEKVPDFKLFPEQKNDHQQQWQIMR